MGKIEMLFNKIKFSCKKHSPEILVTAGVFGMVTSAVLACRATTKLEPVVYEHKAKMEDVKRLSSLKGNSELDYTEKDRRKDSMLIYTHTAINLVKLYGPSVILGGLSASAIFAGNNISRKRNIALAAAYTAVDTGFKKYRNNVVERFGDELDKELKAGVKAKEVEETVVDENGKETVTKKIVNVVDPNVSTSDYSRFFDNGCIGWTKNPEQNLFFLRQQQNWANEKLKSKGYLFLNEVYESLGIPVTKAGNIVGWIYDEKSPSGDNFVDFGIYDANNVAKRDFVNGYERTILLDFNVDGPIYDNKSKFRY